jgi:hypothetical protein
MPYKILVFFGTFFSIKKSTKSRARLAGGFKKYFSNKNLKKIASYMKTLYVTTATQNISLFLQPITHHIRA